MKKVIFILFLTVGMGCMVQAQLLKSLKDKAKSAVDNSVDRSTTKVVDKVINNPADKATDTALDKAGKKVNSVFKKKKKNKKDGDPEQPVTAVKDSVVALPPDSIIAKPQTEN